MAASDDDIEKLLREVEGALGGPTSAPRPGAVEPVPNRAPAAGAAAGAAAGSAARSEALAPAVLIGAGWGLGVGGVFLVLPFLSSFSGAVGAFVAAFSVSFLGRLRRSRSG
jgi:hypothetical protein